MHEYIDVRRDGKMSFSSVLSCARIGQNRGSFE
jgi:hypothetical protein